MSADERTLGERVDAMLVGMAAADVLWYRELDAVAALLREQQAEIERLTKERDAAIEQRDVEWSISHELREHRDKLLLDTLPSLRRDLDAARVDAERYRWLRDNPWPQEVREVVTFHMNAMWDEAIDLARARGEGNDDE